MLKLTFGTDAEREAALHGIRTIHRRVHGTLPESVGGFPAGTPYSAEDPALVLWVHLTLLESVPMVYDLVVAPLSEHERDSYCEEAAWVAVALGARDDEVPRTWAGARAQLQCGYASGRIAVGPQARELANAVLSPTLGRIVPPAAWLNRLVTAGLLPPHVREQYGLAWSETRQRMLDRSIPALRAARRHMPEALALWAEARG